MTPIPLAERIEICLDCAESSEDWQVSSVPHRMVPAHVAPCPYQTLTASGRTHITRERKADALCRSRHHHYGTSPRLHIKVPLP